MERKKQEDEEADEEEEKWEEGQIEPQLGSQLGTAAVCTATFTQGLYFLLLYTSTALYFRDCTFYSATFI